MKIKELYHRLMEYTVMKKLAYAIEFFTTKNVITAASALTYSTILAIIPICAVIFAIARGFGYTKYIEEWFRNLLSTQPTAAEVIIGFVNSYLEHTKSGMILGIGLLFMLYTVVMLTRSVEQTFNDIWHVGNRKNIMRTFTDYVSIFFLIPIIIILISGISLFIGTIAASTEWEEYLGPVMQFIVDIIPFILMWMAFTALYVFMPNTKVKFRYSLIPGFMAAVAMQLLQFFYVHAQMFISNYNAIYGSFAALPLFMLWVYFSWTICLFGAELSYTNQNLEDFSYAHGASTLSHRYQILLSIILMNHICRRFQEGKHPLSSTELKNATGIPMSVTRDLLYKLVKANLLTEILSDVKNSELRYQPALSLEKITVGSMIDRLEASGKCEFPVDLKSQLKDLKHWSNVIELRHEYLDKLSEYRLDKI